MTEYKYPVTFNPYKHHFGFLKKQIKNWQEEDWTKIEKELLYIGNNLIDLYYGNLSSTQILEESGKYFLEKKITDNRKLEKWLNPFEYRKIILSDKSLWIIKQGEDKKKFIHIHPAKNSPFSIRVRATTLKTVIALQIEYGKKKNDREINLNKVNQIRIKFLYLSPIKNLEKGKGISRLWNIFNL